MDKSKKYWAALIALLLIPCLLLAQEQEDIIVKSARTVEPFNRQVPWEIDLGTTGNIEVKLISQWGLPIIELFANNQGPFKFLLDTGADISIISNEFVKMLSLQAVETKRRQLNTSHQKAIIDTSLFILKEIKLGEVVVKNAPFVATNTASDDFMLLKNLNVVGVIGANLFHDIILTLDFPKQKIILSQHQESSIVGNKLKLHEDYYIPIVKAKVQNKKDESEYDLLVDTGYSGFIKMPVCFPYDERKNDGNAIVNYDIFNEEEGGFISELDGILILGDKKIDHPLVKYNIGQCEKMKKWGLIGTAYLQYQSLSIDQKNREVIIH